MTDKEIMAELRYREKEAASLLLKAERYLRSMETLNNNMSKKVVEPGEFDKIAGRIQGHLNSIYGAINGGRGNDR